MKLAAGRQFGHWTLEGNEALGKGGNGVVWRARNTDAQAVAIKFLQSHHFGTQKEKRFRSEVRFLKDQSYESGILPLLDFFLPEVASETERPWFATPLAIPFTELNLSGPANLPKLAELLATVSKNLSKLHAGSKWHRDLKPENLFLLNDCPLIGDLGLVNFPDKEPVTTETEILGPLFYVAPEMMKRGEVISGAPGDVYSLAKTLWVLATGNRYPLQGEQRMDTSALRLSTYCRHPHAHILDSLMERSTAFEPDNRPTMDSFSLELSEWLIIGTTSPPAHLDLAALAKECQGLFEPGIASARNEKQLVDYATVLLSSFDELLDFVANEIHKVTNIAPTISSVHLYKKFQFLQFIGGPRVLWRQAREVRITTKRETTEVYLQGFAQVEALNDNRIRVSVGYLSQPLIHGQSLMNQNIWINETIAPFGSAELLNHVEELKSEFVAKLSDGLRGYVEKVKQYFNV